MAREKRTPEENARREKIRELLQMANIGSMDDIQSLFKETIAEFMENGLKLSWTTNWATAGTTIKIRTRTTAGTGTAAKRCAPALVMWRYPCPGIVRGNSSLMC